MQKVLNVLMNIFTCRIRTVRQSHLSSFIHLRRDRRKSRNRSDQRGKQDKKGGVWTMVSNPEALLQWRMLSWNNQSFWRIWGASCWQCQDRYQPESASATETNNCTTKLLHVPSNSDIYSILCCAQRQQRSSLTSITHRLNVEEELHNADGETSLSTLSCYHNKF